MASEYPEEVWDTLKEVFETSPKMTWQKLIDTAAALLGGCEMPSLSIVRRKAISEKWKKRNKKLVKKSARELNEEIKKLTAENDIQNSDQDIDNTDELHVKNEDKNTSKNQHELVQSAEIGFNGQKGRQNDKKTAVNHRLTASLVIKNNRYRLADLGELVSDTIKSVIHIRDEALQLNLDDPEIGQEELEKKVSSIKFKMGLVSQVVELNLKQSITLSNVGRAEAIYWGLEVEDLKDQVEVNAKRNSAVQDAEHKMKLAKEQMEKGKRDAFRRKLEIIEKGDYEQEIYDEQQAIT